MPYPNQMCYKLMRIKAIFIFCFMALTGQAQIQFGGQPASVQHNLPATEVSVVQIGLEKEMRDQRDTMLGLQVPGEAPLAGFAIPALIDPNDLGQWEIVNDYLHVWRIKIYSPEAMATGVNFSSFQMGEDARLFVFDPDGHTILGAFDHRSNNKNNTFSTALIPGQRIIIEYQEPYYPGKRDTPEQSLLRVESILHLSYGGALTPFGDPKGLGDAGDCMVNINCLEGDDWQTEKRGIARMLMRRGDSYFWCTGSLVNNTRQDGTPYFLSAEHCGRDASDHDLLYWQFYFNLELQGCENVGYPTYNMVFGADNLSLGPLEGGSDFRLLKLHTTPPPHWRPYWNGWDRSDDGSGSGVGIHHPRGDVKKISTYTSNLVSSNPLVSGQQMADNSAWRVIWTPTQNGHGVTEGGSSGSPIFNSEKKIIGTLTGGSSTCDNVYGFDYYGKMWYHWDQNGLSYARRLEQYLDPLNTGAESLPGYDPYEDLRPAPGFVSAALDNDDAVITWFAPGTAPNPDGWYRYVDNYTHLTWAGPERVVVFDAHALGLNYPVYLQKISHTFVEHASHPWPDDQFRFRIYDTDGYTLLYETEYLTAQHLQEYVYELEEPLVFHNYFYVGVDPQHSSNHPSTLMKRVNFGQGYSFSGTAGNWNPHNDGQEGSFAYFTGIYVSQNSETKDLTGLSPAPMLQNLLEQPGGRSAENKIQPLAAPGILPDSYNIYRNNEIIHTAGVEEEMTFTDILEDEEGFFRFYATAVYDNTASGPSNTAYLLKAGECEQVLDQWPYEEIFSAEFDDTCWITYATDNGGWELTDIFESDAGDLAPFAGESFYVLENVAGTSIDQWLITPVMDFSNLEKPALRFMFNSFIESQETYGHLALLASTGNESFVKLWDNRRHPDFDPLSNDLQWLQTTLNLERFGHENNVRLAFQYIGQQTGFFAVDRIQVLNAANITYQLNVSVTPDYAGTVTGQGSYLAGETVRLQAFPNVTYSFDAWLDGGNVIGNEEELWFSMPGTNKSLTARFGDYPTDLETIPDDDSIRIFPNPAKDQIMVHFGTGMPPVSLKLVNIQGQISQRIDLPDIYPGKEVMMPVGHLPAGMYFIHIQGPDTNEILKVIVSE